MGESIVNAELLQVIYMCSLIENAIVSISRRRTNEQMSQGG
mgnify:CR=1 FL=1